MIQQFYACDRSIDTVTVKLEDDLEKFLIGSKETECVLIQLMFLGLKINNSLCLNIDKQKGNQNEHVKLLGVQIDNKSHFDMPVKELCQKLCAFSRIRPFLIREKAKMLLASIVTSNFS